MNLLILGAGGHGRVAADLAEESGLFGNIGFLDDGAPDGSNQLPWPIIGKTSEIASCRSKFASAFVAVGDSQRRLELLALAESANYVIETLVHPRAFVSRRAVLEPGVIVCAGAVVQIGARIGKGSIVNTGASVDHDCILGAGVHVCPGTHLAGAVRVGMHTWIGIGASVRQGVSIGRDVTVGAGAAVVADVDDGTTVLGVPARNRTPS